MILILLIIPLFLIGILATTLKFQLLNPSFWETAFAKNNVYSGLTTVIKKSVEDQTVKEGGSRGEIKIITDLVTTQNIQDFVNRNLENLLNYANGKERALLVYIPVGRAPKGFLPRTFENLPESMPLNSLLQKLNITGVNPSQIQYISLLGRVSLYLLILDAALLILSIGSLFLLIRPGSRFVSPAIALILSGLVTAVAYLAGTVIRIQMARDLVQRTVVADILFGTVVPPLMQEILRIWIIAGMAATLAGILLLFLKKPGKISP